MNYKISKSKMMNASIIFFSCLIVFGGASAQTAQTKNTSVYHEVNAGVAYMGKQYTATGMFPGASFLWGKTDFHANGMVFDRQVGVAFPTILTGKLGIGYGSEKGAALVGIRPWPPAAYLQGNIGTGNGTVLLTAEFTHPELGYSSIFTAGYRWNRRKK